MKVGLVLECGPMGADKKVHTYLAKKIRNDIEIDAVTLDDKKKLLAGCGPAAKVLLKSCARVLIIWDLYPAWRQKGEHPCRHSDRISVFASLDAAGVQRNRVALVCLNAELETWLIADDRAVKTVLAKLKAPHPLGRIVARPKRPESITNPKKTLEKWFKAETGRSYLDRDHAHLIAQAMPDLSRVRGLPTFDRFEVKLR